MAVDKKGNITAYSMKSKGQVKMHKAVIKVFVKGERVTYQAGGFDSNDEDANKVSVLMGRSDALLAIEKGTAKKGEGWNLIDKNGKPKA